MLKKTLLSISLEEVQALAEELTPRDLARLLEHLSGRLARALASEPADATPSLEQLWRQLDAEPQGWASEGTASAELSDSRR